MTNQQETSGMITPGNEKVADFTSIPSSSFVNPPSPYSSSYNQTMGLAGQTVNSPGANQQAYAVGQQAQNAALPPNPAALTGIQKNEQEMQRLQQMYPNVPPEMAKNWLNAQQKTQQPMGHPATPGVGTGISPAGQKANPQVDGLPSGTTSKVAVWRDVNGDIMENGKLYKMTSPKYSVPDYVRVVDNGPEILNIHLDESNMDLTLTESQIRQSNYKFEPMEEEKTSKWKVSSFLSESGLTTFEQRELIDEKGVARNLDRLNLDGTHYPTLASFEQTATMEEDEKSIPEDLYSEDYGLFN